MNRLSSQSRTTSVEEKKPRKRREVKPHRKAEDLSPYRCPRSEHMDGNHSKNWFDGGTCTWCGAK
jgi:hypothetical protein